MAMTDDQPPAQTTNIEVWIGTAAADRAADSTELAVFVPGLTPSLGGAYQPAVSPAEVTTTSPDGVSETTRAVTANHITATYDGSGDTGRLTPPDVRAGERVEIRRVSGEDKYYWRSLGRDNDLRQTEILRFGVAATNDKKSERNRTNTYMVELNSRDGVVKITTSKNLGEPFAFCVSLDTKKGIFALADDVGNLFTLESDKEIWHIKNVSGSTVRMEKENVIVSAAADLILRAERQIVLDAPAVTAATGKKNTVTQFNVDALHVNATRGITYSAPTIGLDGAVKVAGPLVAGQMRAEGYSTGSVGDAYAHGSVDIKSGQGTAPNTTPDGAEATGPVRSAAAWEQFQEAVTVIHACLDDINGRIGLSADYSQLPSLATSARMAKNRGE